MTFYMWDFMYQIIGVSLAVVVSIFIYKIYISTRSSHSGIARNG